MATSVADQTSQKLISRNYMIHALIEFSASSCIKNNGDLVMGGSKHQYPLRFVVAVTLTPFIAG